MNIQELIQRVKNSLNPQEKLSNEAVLGFLRVLENVPGDEISCDEIFAKLDEYVEREAGKKDAADIMPIIRNHLDLCTDCCEEYEALLNVVEKADET